MFQGNKNTFKTNYCFPSTFHHFYTERIILHDNTIVSVEKVKIRNNVGTISFVK